MLSQKIRVGQVVEGTAGREQGRLYFIIKIIDEQYVLISDGKKRKLDRPKLKKVKHLKVYDFLNNKVKNKIASDQMTDAFLRAELTKSKIIFD
ncbi:MAG: KOW domain-containing protein [Peptostreptococcaceae bacterium]